MIRLNFYFYIAMLLMGALLVFTPSCKNNEVPQVSEKSASKVNETIAAYYQKALDSAAFYLAQMDTNRALKENQAILQKSRRWYKLVEPLMIAYDHENYKTVNAPNLLKVEIDDFTDIKRIKPKSYQVLEEVLYADEELDNQTLQHCIIYLKARLPFMSKNHMIARQNDSHHLRMLIGAIVNIATKGITGFDSPMLSNSLQEAIYNYQTIEYVLLDIYKDTFKGQDLKNQWKEQFQATFKVLSEGDFDTFDRYGFIKNHTNKQLELIQKTAQDWGVELEAKYALNPNSTNLFGKEFYNVAHFAPPHSPEISEDRIDLGRALFNDTNLSGSGMSCATCHLKEKAFTDGLKVAKGNDGGDLLRNSPTLKYATYQRLFFWDGMSSTLESQVISVVNNAKEFHIDLSKLEEKVKKDEGYKMAFDSLYDGKMGNQNIRHAIATYIRSLSPFNSKFDKSITGEATLDQVEIDGFNLFMGKAACATCHFPPAFNGTVPPKYLETEFENLGTPANASFTAPTLDQDPGAFEPYKVEERRHFFKTPTVRNAALTAPYMHNGVYDSLEQVVKFYNVGGGVGMGLDVPYQTLPPDSLNLTDYETKALIRFMESLTDSSDVSTDTPQSLSKL